MNVHLEGFVHTYTDCRCFAINERVENELIRPVITIRSLPHGFASPLHPLPVVSAVIRTSAWPLFHSGWSANDARPSAPPQPEPSRNPVSGQAGRNEIARTIVLTTYPQSWPQGVEA
jgi:hypothetical protein